MRWPHRTTPERCAGSPPRPLRRPTPKQVPAVSRTVTVLAVLGWLVVLGCVGVAFLADGLVLP
jgi:hypothetical protein